MSKRKARSLMTKSNLIDENGVLQKFLLLLYIKMSNTAYYQRNREVILNKAKGYYENHKQKLREQARYKYKDLSEEEKIKKREYGKNRYHNMSEEKKQKLK